MLLHSLLLPGGSTANQVVVSGRINSWPAGLLVGPAVCPLAFGEVSMCTQLGPDNFSTSTIHLPTRSYLFLFDIYRRPAPVVEALLFIFLLPQLIIDAGCNYYSSVTNLEGT